MPYSDLKGPSDTTFEGITWKPKFIGRGLFQAIIPREASKGIILGGSSYTLIDDNGVEFYLSDKDKRRRENGEDPREETAETEGNAKSTTTKKKTVSIRSVLSEDEQYQKAAAQLASRAASATGQKEAGFFFSLIICCLNKLGQGCISTVKTHATFDHSLLDIKVQTKERAIQRSAKRLVRGCKKFLLLLLMCSACPAWVLLSKICIPFSRSLYSGCRI